MNKNKKTHVEYRDNQYGHLTLLHVNLKGTDQPAHQHSLISTFVIHYMESLVVKLAPCKKSIFLLVDIAEQAYLVSNLEDRFPHILYTNGFLFTV